MNSDVITAIHERLQVLERQNRKYRTSLGAAMIALAVSLAIGANFAADVKGVEAEKFVLKGADGKTLLLMEADQSGLPRLQLFDRQGKARLMLGVDEFGGPTLGFADRDGELRIRMEVNEAGGSQLIFTDPNGNPRMDFSVFGDKPDQPATLTFCGADSQPRMELGMSISGNPALLVYGKRSK